MYVYIHADVHACAHAGMCYMSWSTTGAGLLLCSSMLAFSSYTVNTCEHGDYKRGLHQIYTQYVHTNTCIYVIHTHLVSQKVRMLRCHDPCYDHMCTQYVHRKVFINTYWHLTRAQPGTHGVGMLLCHVHTRNILMSEILQKTQKNVARTIYTHIICTEKTWKKGICIMWCTLAAVSRTYTKNTGVWNAAQDTKETFYGYM
jgi:hypothetical protein